MLDDTTNKIVYDAIVIGLGGHGSAAVAHLAKRGAKVYILLVWLIKYNIQYIIFPITGTWYRAI